MRVGARARLEAGGAAALDHGAVVAGAVAGVDQRERLAGELGERDARPPGQGMVARHRHHRRLVAQRLALDARARLGAEPDREVEPAVGDLLGERAGAVLARPHPHRGTAAGELGQERLGDVVGAGREAEPQLAGLALGVAAHDLLHRGGGVDRRARGLERRRARLGQLDPRARAVEQADAELALEPRDLLAERGLRDVHARRGAAEVKLARERHECVQQPRVERHAPSL